MGACVADLGEVEAAKIVELDLGMTERVRAEFPFQADADRFIITP